MITRHVMFVLYGLALLLMSGCGGGGNGGNETLSLQESQRYFPLSDGNVWVTRVTNSENGSMTSSYTRVVRHAGTRLVGNVIASVISNSDLPSVSTLESYLVKDDSGIMAYGNNNPLDTLTASLVPYRVVSFPIRVGSSFRQLEKSWLRHTQDNMGEITTDKIDLTSDVVVRGFEAISTAAGTFTHCLRIDTNVTETLTLSSSGTKLTASGVETVWYAQDVGPVKQVSTITANGTTRQTSEELSGYMVDGRCSGLSLKVTPDSATINAGTTTQLSVTLLDAGNNELMTMPAAWASDRSAVATVDANGLATGNSIGRATLTPSVGGVAGPAVTLNVLYGFGQSSAYPAPASLSISWCGDTAMGDLNGDGRNDVAVMERGGSRVLVYYQNSAGTLDAAQVIATPLNLAGIAIRDVSNDGLADLVVSGNSSSAQSGWLGRVAVFRQNSATHALNAPQEYALSTNAAESLAIADLNSDGLPDIVVASSGNSGTGLLSFLFQRAGGVNGPEQVYTSVPFKSGGEIHVADMNSDGRNDIVVQSDSMQLAVIKQVSAGAYSAAPEYYTVQTSYWPYFNSFALGDLNGDGRTDIAVADLGNDGYLNVFLQNASGNLAGPNLINFTSSSQTELKISDIDGDGLNDILILSGGRTIFVLLQSASHTFQNFQMFYLPTQSSGGTPIHQAMSVGDITGDSLPDVVASWSNEGVFVLPRR